MGKERFLKELGLRREVVEPGEAKSETIRGDSESEDKKPHPPTEENSDAPEAELEAPQPIEESAEHLTEQPPAKEPVTKPGERHVEIEKEQSTTDQIRETEAEIVEGVSMENVGDSADSEGTPESTPFLGSKAADEIESRATLATATILPLSLLGSKKAWVWIVVLICVAIAGYFLLRWYSRRGEVTSLPREAVKTSSGDPVRDFLDDY